MTRRAVKLLNPEVARKIAAGEVIDRPNAIVRELMDNAVDSGATKIDVEITGGGIEKIRVIDNGCGMSREDLITCAHPHATSKISSEEDLMNLSTLGFRGEALSSMAAVGRLEIQSGGYKMNASVTEDHVITPCSVTNGTIVQTSRLFENFPARRVFLKREASEALMCRNTFEEKVLPRPDIAFTFTSDGEEKLSLPQGQTLTERFIQTMEFFENKDLFYELKNKDSTGTYSFTIIIGEPGVTRNSRKNIYVYVNGRRIQEYSLVQAVEYGVQGYFPNGTHPIACLFIEMDPSLVDFNIHPAKREARFKDIGPLHHAVSTTIKNFFKQYTIKNLINTPEESYAPTLEGFLSAEQKTDSGQKTGTEQKSEYEYKSQNYNSFHAQSPRINGIKLNLGASSGEKRSDARSRFFNADFYAYEAKSETFSTDINNNVNFNAPAPEDSETLHTETKEKFKANYCGREENFRYIGLALGTFIIAQKDDTLYIIDQHAAHERIIFNGLVDKAGEKQNLLIPYEFTTESKADDNFLKEIKDDLIDSGFTCSSTGEGKWTFTTVPAKWKGNEEDLKHDLLDRRINPKDLLRSILASNACRSAVMDGTVLDDETAAWIAEEALKLPDPHCPHGRPVFTKITREQLFSLVRRT